MRRVFLSLLVALILGGVYAPASGFAENTATNPAPRPGQWLERHEGFVKQAGQGSADLLFLGDSITDHWRDRGSNVWARYYEPLRAANFGISGDRTQNVLWRIKNGEIKGIRPKVVVLMIGTNNTGKEKDHKTIRNTALEVIEGVTAIVNDLHAELPETRILLLAIFPRDKPDSPFRDQLKQINAALSKLGDGKIITYLDISPKFLGPDGTLIPGVMLPDNLHPTDKGYAVWAEAMKPTLDAMLR